MRLRCTSSRNEMVLLRARVVRVLRRRRRRLLLLLLCCLLLLLLLRLLRRLRLLHGR